jgi:hypothetical protein
MPFIKIANSSHSRCFICNRNGRNHQVKHESVYHAYIHHNIYIKHHARCCYRHLDENGLILMDHFERIPAKIQHLEQTTINLLKNMGLSSSSSGIFEKFKHFSTISEEECFQITRWTKEQFNAFSKFINSVYDTVGRTKEQMIAIYRYWLRKGIDQSSLAMFKNTTSQQQISHYLSQIRVAIHKDFVPFYLGASKGRDFFIRHNNSTTKELFQLKNTDLAIFVDGTYAKLEKSSNNQFQYNCWSQQKMDLLIKPFLITCADGYIIDCYGPFQANTNDATIFQYILDTDEKLMEILKPHETYVIMDRGNKEIVFLFLKRHFIFSIIYFTQGFRDIFSSLKNKYNFIPKIPTCDQLEKNENKDKGFKQLTTLQTSESRLVTKVTQIKYYIFIFSFILFFS